MGTIITARDFSMNIALGVLKPIIYCGSFPEIDRNAISLNKTLAEKLLECRPSRRTMKVEGIFNEIISLLPEEAVIKDFDVLFNPAYKIDVLKIMINACRHKKFGVLWPGRYENGKLFYAEEGFEDYKSFIIEDYDITCVIEGGK